MALGEGGGGGMRGKNPGYAPENHPHFCDKLNVWQFQFVRYTCTLVCSPTGMTADHSRPQSRLALLTVSCLI